VEEILK